MNLRRLEEKLPSIIVDKPTTTREGSAEYQNKGRQLRRLKQRDPSRYLAALHKVADALNEMDREAIDEIDRFNANCRAARASKRLKKR